MKKQAAKPRFQQGDNVYFSHDGKERAGRVMLANRDMVLIRVASPRPVALLGNGRRVVASGTLLNDRQRYGAIWQVSPSDVRHVVTGEKRKKAS